MQQPRLTIVKRSNHYSSSLVLPHCLHKHQIVRFTVAALSFDSGEGNKGYPFLSSLSSTDVLFGFFGGDGKEGCRDRKVFRLLHLGFDFPAGFSYIVYV
ncbi:hypothetical protein RHMOL_Rhmol04G0163200 [Rhododendron molle]|uniref:Uncharacterized protein n=1 Tax=Rhododendron molle TaxID=49168 RepID=A0ACC0P2Y2_RHOML|nr:hypothetical protein RHMOL_Rhmol04G0163200 [Rhododendron molle]